MPAKQEIDQKYKDEHSELSASYYVRKELSKDVFDQQHGALWNRHEQELISGGFVIPRLSRMAKLRGVAKSLLLRRPRSGD